MKIKSLIFFAILCFFVSVTFAQDNENSEDTAKTGTFTDKRDNKTYNTIRIGKQTWMAQNLAYRPKGSGGGYWSYNFTMSNVDKYGYLYAFVVATTACPKGWHLPSDDEWRVLTKFLGGEPVSGVKLKSVTGWKASDSSKGTDESGFNGLPGGFRDGYGTFYSLNEIGYWWTSTPSSAFDYAWLRGLFYDRVYVGRYENFRPSGLSVRCLKNLTKAELKQQQKEQEETEEKIEE